MSDVRVVKENEKANHGPGIIFGDHVSDKGLIPRI